MFRLEGEGKGLRQCVFRIFRTDGQQQEIAIGTNRASRHAEHLFQLFALKIPTIAPGLGIDLDERLAARFPINDDPSFDMRWGELRRKDGSIAKP